MQQLSICVVGTSRQNLSGPIVEQPQNQHHCLGSRRFPADNDLAGWDGPDSKTKIPSPTLTKPPEPINSMSTHIGKSTAHMRSADDGGRQALEGRAYVK